MERLGEFALRYDRLETSERVGCRKRDQATDRPESANSYAGEWVGRVRRRYAIKVKAVNHSRRVRRSSAAFVTLRSRKVVTALRREDPLEMFLFRSGRPRRSVGNQKRHLCYSSMTTDGLMGTLSGDPPSLHPGNCPVSETWIDRSGSSRFVFRGAPSRYGGAASGGCPKHPSGTARIERSERSCLDHSHRFVVPADPITRELDLISISYWLTAFNSIPSRANNGTSGKMSVPVNGGVEDLEWRRFHSRSSASD